MSETCATASSTKVRPWTRWHTIRYHSELGSPWILRNLSKKVYVRADKLALKPGDIGPAPWTIKGMSFGSLVASRIAWSRDMHRGNWAGDRFDIADIDDVEEDWEDVSAEVKSELGELWKLCLGDKWEEKVVADL